jgi:hypothetical protein
MTDKRLLGIWRSDRRRTLKEWVFKTRATPKRRKVVRSMFGFLTLRFTRHRVYSEFKGYREVHGYKILGSDSSSVAITYWNSLLGEWTIQHIHFERGCYWITLGRNREFFRGVRPTKKAAQRTVSSRFAQVSNRVSPVAGSHC